MITCQGCKKELLEGPEDYPYVEKHWGEINGEEVMEYWHTKCFVIWHSAHVGLYGEQVDDMIKKLVK